MRILKNNWGLLLFFFCFSMAPGFKLSAQSPFLPSNITGLKLWICGDSVSTSVFPVVDTCYDLSGNLNHAVQTTAAAKPLSATSNLNGHKVINFDGTDDFVGFNLISDIRTVFWVVKEDSFATLNYRPLLGHPTFYDFYRAGSTKNIWDGSNTNNSILTGTTSVNSTQVNGQNTAMPTQYSILSVVTTANVRASNFSQDENVSSRVWHGQLAELIIYNQALTPTEVLQVEQYLSAKYSPPIDLGANIVIPYGYCDTVLDVGPRFSNIIWSTGDTTQSISVNKTGTYWVQAQNIFGYTSFDTIEVTYPALNYPIIAANTICHGDTVQWSTGLPATTYNFLWQDNSTDSVFDISFEGQYHFTVTDTNSCSFNSDTVNVDVDSFAVVASLGPDTFFCGPHTIALASGASYNPSYLWSDLSNNDSLFVSSSGPYWLTATSINGCIKQDTVNINIVPLPVFDFGNDTVVCFYQNISLDPGISGTFTYLWSDNSTNPVLPISASGLYWLKLQDGFGCNYSDTIAVAIDSLLYAATLGPDQTFCAGNSIALVSGAAVVTSYLWNDFSTNDSLQIFFSGSYSVSVFDSLGCSVSDSINITISGTAPSINFDVDTACFLAGTQFTDLSVAPGSDVLAAWAWNFGDTTTSILQNPSHIYADTGIYVATLTVTTNIGCSSTLSKNVHVYPKPLADYGVTGACDNVQTLFTDQSTTYGYPVVSWNWNFGDAASGAANSSFLQNPAHSFDTNLVFSVQMIITNFWGCSDTVTKNVMINESPIAGYYNSIACTNVNVQFTDTTYFPITDTIASSYWHFGGSNVSSQLNPSHLFFPSGPYNIFHTITLSNGCSDTVQKVLTVHSVPIADFSHDSTCVGAPVTFTDASISTGGNLNGWAWDFDGISTSTTQNSLFTFNTAGLKTIQLVVTSDLGCADTAVQIINVHPLPVPQFSATPDNGTPPLVSVFSNSSSGASSYTWDFGDGSAQSSLQNPTHTFADTGAYLVSLTATSNFGCVKSVSDSIFVYSRVLDIVVVDFSTTLQNNFLTIHAIIQNAGNVSVTNMDLYFWVNDGGMIKETWTGNFTDSSAFIYTFTSEVYVEDQEHYICVAAEKPNGFDDDVPQNNKLCKSLGLSAFQVLDFYPNPAQDQFTVPLFAPKDGKLEITFFDAHGKIVQIAYSGAATKGLQFITLNSADLSKGMYLCKIQYGDKIVVRKFLKD